MSPADLQDLQKSLGMDVPQFARFFCIGERTVRRIFAGAQDIPLWIEVYGDLIVEIRRGDWGTAVRDRMILDRENFIDRPKPISPETTSQ